MLVLLHAAAFAGACSVTSQSAVLVTGANKGQGYALCRRVLKEHADAYVFVGSRDPTRGAEATAVLASLAPGRVEHVTLDVTDDASVAAAAAHVASRLAPDAKLHGLVSNAGILWGHTLAESVAVNTLGVKRVTEAFLPVVRPGGGRVVVVSSGMGPLMVGYASAARRERLLAADLTWAELEATIDECLAVEAAGSGPAGLEALGFSGGQFAEAAPDFHTYGLAKMFADAHMLTVARAHPALRVNSCDPGLVFTDIVKSIPRYEGMSREETGAATPDQGVEAAMRLLFGEDGAPGSFEGSGMFYAMDKARVKLLRSTIAARPKEIEAD